MSDDTISRQVREFADEWDRLVNRFNGCCEDVREAYQRADETVDALKELQARYAALESESGGERLQPLADAKLDEIWINEPEWVDRMYELPQVELLDEDEADGDEEDGEPAP
jgi:hypothetical protein